MITPSPRFSTRAGVHVGPRVYHTPTYTTRLLSELTGFDVRFKAEMFQWTGS